MKRVYRDSNDEERERAKENISHDINKFAAKHEILTFHIHDHDKNNHTRTHSMWHCEFRLLASVAAHTHTHTYNIYYEIRKSHVHLRVSVHELAHCSGPYL